MMCNNICRVLLNEAGKRCESKIEKPNCDRDLCHNACSVSMPKPMTM